jgi:ubiquinone/menaquinone biosynthesis C-methylase UbiE
MTNELIQSQFGKSAESYATSSVHAKGRSLIRLLEAQELKPYWRVLDVATGAGHTAFAIAPKVETVIATDITSEMLQLTSRLAREKNIPNLAVSAADALNLPFSDESFEVITCRIAAHHFSEPQSFVSEAARVLRDGGSLVLIDNVVPNAARKRKKAKRGGDVGRYLNAFERLRDASHVRSLSQDEWSECFYQSGLRVVHQETIEKRMDFDEWGARMQVSEKDTARLLAMLRQAPVEVSDYIKPQFAGNKASFALVETMMIGLKES